MAVLRLNRFITVNKSQVGCSSPAALEKAMPVLQTMGKHVFVMGSLGAGHAMKTLNNYVSAASICGLCDALVAGEMG